MSSIPIHLFLWSFPVAMSMHVFEEFVYPGGLVEWIRIHKPRRLKSNSYYVAVNAVTILIGVFIALLARGIVGYCLFLNFVALMGGNAVSHIRASLQSGKYCPGTFTASVVLLPLLLFSLWFLLTTESVDWLSAAINTCAGAFVGFYVFSVDVRRIDREESVSH